MQLKDSKGQIVYIEDIPFAHGGEGDVHKVIGTLYTDCCVKIFHNGKIACRKAKLEYMIKHPLVAPKNSNYRICWPIDFVFNGNDCVGFVMILSFPSSHLLYEIYLKEGSDFFERTTERGISNRLKLLYNISNAISILHVSGYLLVDFKPQNILFTNSGKISMIDMDSVQIVVDGNLKFGSTAITLEYAYPKELHKITAHLPLTTSWDVYGFAIVCYQILMGVHPFAASTNVVGVSTQDQLMSNNLFPFGSRRKDIFTVPPPHYYYLMLEKNLRKLFVETFDLTKIPPSMFVWKNTLKDVIQNGVVVPNQLKTELKNGNPLFFLVSDMPENCNVNDLVDLEWKTFNCQKLIVKGVDSTGANIVKVSVPEDRIIEIVASNPKATIKKKIIFSVISLFCAQCGTNFEFTDNKYCSNCGAKRE